jgi:replicative DNA helicase
MRVDPVELAVIGPILFGDDLAISKVDELGQLGFESKHFTHPACQIVWDKVKEFMNHGVFTLEKLQSFCLNCEGIHQDHVNRALFLSDAIKSGSSLTMAENALELMERHLRQETEVAIASVPKTNANAMLDELESKLSLLRSKGASARKDEKLEACKELHEEIDAMLEGRKRMKSSHVPTWDSAFGGLPEANLVVISGRPGGCKTSCAEQIIDETVRRNEPVLYIQRELSRSRAIGRLACRRARVPWCKFENKTMNKEESLRLKKEVEIYEKLPLFLAPARNCNSFTISPLVRYHAKHHEVKLVVMDYVQLIDVPKGLDKRIAIGDVTRALKLAANETKATIIAIAQLSRNSEKSGDRPSLSDLKESGDIEQDADVVLSFWLSKDRNDQPRWPVNWSILKNRNGALGDSEVMFDGPSMSFLGRTTQNI